MDYKRKFKEHPFRYLIENDEELIELRKKYFKSKTDERRKAANYAYHEFMANDLFNRLLNEEKDDAEETESWESGIIALAIDPTYAPAFLTVGTLEYQLGREDEAMELFVKFKKAIRLNPYNQNYPNNLGYLLFEMGELVESEKYLRKAVSLAPEDYKFAENNLSELMKAKRKKE